MAVPASWAGEMRLSVRGLALTCAVCMHACASVHTRLCMSVGAGLRVSREGCLAWESAQGVWRSWWGGGGGGGERVLLGPLVFQAPGSRLQAALPGVSPRTSRARRHLLWPR